MKRAVVISTDPLADMFTRIRNAIAANKSEVSLPHSKVKETVARILARQGFISDVNSTKDAAGRKLLNLVINPEGLNAPLTEITRLSTPGRRIYVKTSEIPAVKRGRGIVVVSTSAGVMTGEEAKSKRLGGELICKVY